MNLLPSPETATVIAALGLVLAAPAAALAALLRR